MGYYSQIFFKSYYDYKSWQIIPPDGLEAWRMGDVAPMWRIIGLENGRYHLGI